MFIQFLLFVKFDDINTKEYYLLKNILLYDEVMWKIPSKQTDFYVNFFVTFFLRMPDSFMLNIKKQD